MPSTSTDPGIPLSTAGPQHAEELASFFASQAIGSASFAYRIDRSPDFFRYCRLQGHAQRVLIAESDGIQGVLSVLFDRVHLDETSKEVAYLGDLRLDPAVRGQGLGDRLMREGVRTCRETNGPDVPIVAAVMADNPGGLRKLANLDRDGIARMRAIAEVSLTFILPWGGPASRSKFRTRTATIADLPRMHALWQRLGPNRPLSRSFTLPEWEHWVLESPGLGIAAYTLAEDDSGELMGFLAGWDMSPVRRFMLATESASQRALRLAWNALRLPLRLPRFPKPGEALPFLAATNLCVSDAEAFRPLLRAVLTQARRQGALFVGLALDARDPLNQQMRGLPASRSTLRLMGNEAFPPDGPERQAIYHVEIAMG